ncbi:ATP-binding protein [Orenia marismortui]|uniref:P-loop uncharacterized protein DUF2791 n=1 Tax=Orenia marismortui TaxID=46469 RepID=A0A4R8GVU0_9FIRM|nr:ATP-binding protein [Orenia marismortui]TDX49141.1 P-loop uncharacterized protein DUF2791 [Orenia marismortui]
MKIKRKESSAIINALNAGVVPRIGLHHILVGRDQEVQSFLKDLKEVEEGSSKVKFWIGNYGSGKSFMLHLMRNVALEKNFVVADMDFSPEKRLSSSGKRAVATYTELMNNLSIKTKQDNALVTILDKWINQIIMKTSQKYGFSPTELDNLENQKIIKNTIMETLNQLSDVGGFDFGVVISKYFDGYINNDDFKTKSALKWLRGEYATKTEAREDLGVRKIIDSDNYYDMLKNFSDFVIQIGYSGLMLNFDEAVNLFKITHTQSRERNYEKILTIFNDCLQGKSSHLHINFAGTKEFLEDERRGLYSYNALKTRLQTNPFENKESRDFSQPVIKLAPLDHNEIFVLLQKLLQIFNSHHKSNIDLTQEEIKNFMEDIYNRPGANELLTPRDVIRDFLHALNIIRQNPEYNRNTIFSKVAQDQDEDEVEDNDDNIEDRFTVEEF